MRRAEIALHNNTLEGDLSVRVCLLHILADILVESLDSTLTWNVMLILNIQEMFDTIRIVLVAES